MTVYNQDSIKTIYPEFVGKANWAFKDITNQNFGRLTTLYRYYENRDGKAVWVCRCECGNITLVTGKLLRSGNTLSCGCYQKDMAIKSNMNRAGEFIGKKFGYLTPIKENGFIIGYNGKRRRLIQCRCDCGNIKDIQIQYLLYGDTKSCGCLKSYGENFINDYLLNQDIDFQREFMFKDLKLILNLRFDFAIFKEGKLFGLIEFNGEQHYNKSNGYYSEDIEKTDKMKIDYCLENNIPLITIKYNDDIVEKLNKFMGDYYDN